MSGHSKWSTIKRKKEATDAVRGKLFSKLSRAITIAVKTGGGSDPDANAKLRVAIETAKSANMPKANIDRAMQKGEGASDLEEIIYEGFGPEGIGVILEVATDSRNRSAQVIKGLFDRGGGNLSGPGSVSFNFEQKGMIVLKNKGFDDEAILKLIDAGVEEYEIDDDFITLYVAAKDLMRIKDDLGTQNFLVESAEHTMKPRTTKKVNGDASGKVIAFLERLQENDDVQKLYTDAEFEND